MKTKLFSLLSIFYISCDPMLSNYTIINQKNDTIHIRMIGINKENRFKYIDGHSVVLANENNTFGDIRTWGNIYNEILPDTLLNVVVFKNYQFLNDTHEQSNNLKSDSLLSKGDYEYKNYSYKDLEKSDWKINYPKDGFKKGFQVTPLKK